MFPIRSAINGLCLLLSAVCRWPQIWSQMQRKSAEGLSPSSLVLDLTCTTVTLSYCIANAYSISNFIEYPVLLAQNILLLGIFVFYSGTKLRILIPATVFWQIGFYSLSKPLVPLGLLSLMSSSVPLLNAMSKIEQIRYIVRTNRGDLVSRVPWSCNGTVSAIRLLTVLQDSGDLILIMNFVVSIVSNASVVIAAHFYQPRKKQPTEKEM